MYERVKEGLRTEEAKREEGTEAGREGGREAGGENREKVLYPFFLFLMKRPRKHLLTHSFPMKPILQIYGQHVPGPISS